MTELRFKDRIVVVTGASRGIGRAVAEALGREGAHVVAVARTEGGLAELDDAVSAAGGSTTLVPLDLKDSAGIDRLGAALLERYGRIDALFGNAGILGVLSPLGHVAPKVWDEVMAVNVTANWRLVRSLDPLLRQSDSGRALFVTSGAARNIRAYWGPYAVSKAALEALVKTYAAELNVSAAKANLFNPGPLRTRMRAQAMPGEDPESLEPPERVAPHILGLLAPDCTANGEIFDYSAGALTRAA